MNRVSNRDASSRNNQNRQRNRGRNNNNSNNNSSNNSNNNNNNRRGPNPLQRSYESNGPDVKIRGNAMQVAEKYQTLARDAQVAGDRILAENYLQHAEHYSRIIAAAQAANQQTQQAQQAQQQQEGQQASSDNEQMNGSGPQPGLEASDDGASTDKPQEVPKAPVEAVESNVAAAAEPEQVVAAEVKPERKRTRRPKVEAVAADGEPVAEVAEKPARKPRTRKPKATEPEMAVQTDAAE